MQPTGLEAKRDCEAPRLGGCELEQRIFLFLLITRLRGKAERLWGKGKKGSLRSCIAKRQFSLKKKKKNHRVPDPATQHLEGFGIPKLPKAAFSREDDSGSAVGMLAGRAGAGQEGERRAGGRGPGAHRSEARARGIRSTQWPPPSAGRGAVAVAICALLCK